MEGGKNDFVLWELALGTETMLLVAAVLPFLVDENGGSALE